MRLLMIGVALSCAACAQPYTLGAVLHRAARRAYLVQPPNVT